MADPAEPYRAGRAQRNQARGAFDRDLAALRGAVAGRRDAAKDFAVSHKAALGGAAALLAGLSAAWLLRDRIGALLARSGDAPADDITDGADDD